MEDTKLSKNLHSDVITAEKPVVELPYDFFAPKTNELPEEVRIALGYSPKVIMGIEHLDRKAETPKTTQTINQFGKNFILAWLTVSSSVTMALLTLALVVATIDYFTYGYSYLTILLATAVTVVFGMVTRKFTVMALDRFNRAITNNFMSPVVTGLIIVGLSLSCVAIHVDNASPLAKDLMVSIKKNSPWQQKRDIADAEQREIRSKIFQWEANSYATPYATTQTTKPKAGDKTTAKQKVKAIEPMPKSNSSLY